MSNTQPAPRSSRFEQSNADQKMTFVDQDKVSFAILHSPQGTEPTRSLGARLLHGGVGLVFAGQTMALLAHLSNESETRIRNSLQITHHIVMEAALKYGWWPLRLFLIIPSRDNEPQFPIEILEAQIRNEWTWPIINRYDYPINLAEQRRTFHEDLFKYELLVQHDPTGNDLEAVRVYFCDVEVTLRKDLRWNQMRNFRGEIFYSRISPTEVFDAIARRDPTAYQTMLAASHIDQTTQQSLTGSSLQHALDASKETWQHVSQHLRQRGGYSGRNLLEPLPDPTPVPAQRGSGRRRVQPAGGAMTLEQRLEEARQGDKRARDDEPAEPRPAPPLRQIRPKDPAVAEEHRKQAEERDKKGKKK